MARDFLYDGSAQLGCVSGTSSEDNFEIAPERNQLYIMMKPFNTSLQTICSIANLYITYCS